MCCVSEDPEDNRGFWIGSFCSSAGEKGWHAWEEDEERGLVSPLCEISSVFADMVKHGRIH
jgi:hypothetical protein